MGRLKQKLYIDCTSTNRINITSGIQRVVRKLLDGMPYISVQLDLEVVPISGQFGDYYLQKDAEEMSVDNFEQYDPVEFNYNDIYFCPDAFWSCEIYKWYEYFNSKGLIIVTTIYDLIPLDEREFTSKNERELFKVALDSIIQYSDMLLTPTLATKQELVSYLIENEPDINHPRVEVSKIAPIFWNDSITNNVPNVESIGEKKNDFLLMVGTLEKRRGYLETIESLVNYWDNGGKLQLKIVGKVADDTIALKISEFSNSGYPVENMTSVNDVELLSLYENSKAIICSSLSEGYGLSVAEGLLLNGKVIANKIPVFGEFAGSMPYYFDINNPKQLVELVKNVDSLKPVETPTFVEWDECYDELIRHLVSVSPLHEKNVNLSPGLLNKAFVYQSLVALGLDEPDSDVLKYWLANYSDPHEFLSALYYESTQKTTELSVHNIYRVLGLGVPNKADIYFWKSKSPNTEDFINEVTAFSAGKTTDSAIYHIYKVLGLGAPDKVQRDFWKSKHPDIEGFVNEVVYLSTSKTTDSAIYHIYKVLGLGAPDKVQRDFWKSKHPDIEGFVNEVVYLSTSKTTDLAIYYIYHALGLREPDDEAREFWKKRYPEVSDFVNELKEIK